MLRNQYPRTGDLVPYFSVWHRSAPTHSKRQVFVPVLVPDFETGLPAVATACSVEQSVETQPGALQVPVQDTAVRHTPVVFLPLPPSLYE